MHTSNKKPLFPGMILNRPSNTPVLACFMSTNIMREKQERRSLFGKRGWLLSRRSLLPLFRLKASSARSAFIVTHSIVSLCMLFRRRCYNQPLQQLLLLHTCRHNHFKRVFAYYIMQTTSEPILLYDPACVSRFIMMRDQSNFHAS